MRLKQLFMACLALTFAAAPALADTPNLLNYQGRLTDPSGNPSNGTFSMTFAVYDADSGGNPLPAGTPWSETQNVTVSNGVFNVLLGSVTALPTTLFQGGFGPSDSSGPLRFLQVVVNGEELSPRKRMASVAYSLPRQGTARVTTTGFSIPDRIVLPVRFPSEHWDEGCDGEGMHSASEDHYLRVCEKGFYTISCSIEMNNTAGGGRELAILHFGTKIAAQSALGTTSVNPTITVTTIYELDPNDPISCTIYQNSGANDAASYAHMTIARLGLASR